MFRAAPRLIARPASLRAIVPRPTTRFLSTAPPAQKSRSWKSLFARLGIAGAIIYYYNTNDLFREEEDYPAHALTPESELPTIESISAEREKRRAVKAQLDAQRRKEEEEAANAKTQDEASAAPTEKSEGGLGGLEEEAGQQGAFNPETGEINWDCPCLGGMATGPCGEEFKGAFSCFVFSEEEPKGMDCIDKFKVMQNCFRQYPEVYGSELESDADDEDAADDNDDDLTPDVDMTPTSPAPDATHTDQQPAPTRKQQTSERAAQAKTSPEPSSKPHSPEKLEENRRELGLVPENYRPKEKKKKQPVSESESETLVPKAAHDASDATAEDGGKKSKAGERK